MTAPTPPAGLTVATANLSRGSAGHGSSPETALAVLRPLRPDILLVQGAGADDPSAAWRAIRRLAGGMLMQPVLGPPAAAWSQSGSHTAILVAADRGLRVTDQWPPPLPAGPAPPFCGAEILVRGLTAPLRVYSARLPARVPSLRRAAAELLASYAAEAAGAGIHVLAGGTWNTIPRAGQPGPEQLAAMPPGLLLARCREAPGGGWEPDFTVDDLLARAGLRDLAGQLPPERRDPPELAPTAPGLARVDRLYGTPLLTCAVTACRQVRTGRQHEAVSFAFDLTAIPASAPASLTGLARGRR